jgi:hypothetical protein
VSGLDAHLSSLTNGILSPDRSLPSESLYRLRYPGPRNCIVQALSSIAVKNCLCLPLALSFQEVQCNYIPWKRQDVNSNRSRFLE